MSKLTGPGVMRDGDYVIGWNAGDHVNRSAALVIRLDPDGTRHVLAEAIGGDLTEDGMRDMLASTAESDREWRKAQRIRQVNTDLILGQVRTR